MIIVICLLMQEKSLNLKLIINFPTQFCLGSISNGFNTNESREVEMPMIFQSITILLVNMTLDIHKYLMTKNNIKQCSPSLLYY